MTAEWDDLARLAAAIPPPERRDWTYQSWGEQNQNGDHADSILYDGRGETIVYELSNDIGEFIAAANPATILRLIEDYRRLWAHGQSAANFWKREHEALADRLAAVEALLADGPDTWEGFESHDTGHVFVSDAVLDFTADLRAALAAPTDTTKEN